MYERTYGTIKGLKNRDTPEIEDEVLEHGDDDDEDGHSDGKKPKSSEPVDKEKPKLLLIVLSMSMILEMKSSWILMREEHTG